MKQVISLAIVGVLSLLVSQTQAFSLNGEFITGFESGIFLRNSDDIYDDYGCPRARPGGAMGNLAQVVAPLKMVGALAKDKNIEHLIEAVEVFVDSLSSLIGVFSGYDGGEFCTGLIFGSNGAHMLTNIAKALVNIKEREAQKTSGHKALSSDRDDYSSRSSNSSRSSSQDRDSGSVKDKFRKSDRN